MCVVSTSPTRTLLLPLPMWLWVELESADAGEWFSQFPRNRPYVHACGFDSLLAPRDDNGVRFCCPTADVFARVAGACAICLFLQCEIFLYQKAANIRRDLVLGRNMKPLRPPHCQRSSDGAATKVLPCDPPGKHLWPGCLQP